VLIIHGQADALVPVGNSTRLAAMLPGAELVVLPACGHVPQEEQPQQFVDAIVDFFDRKQGEQHETSWPDQLASIAALHAQRYSPEPEGLSPGHEHCGHWYGRYAAVHSSFSGTHG